MAKKNTSGDLVIVESPAKAKTIEKYLGDGFTVLSSYGHVRDLPERARAKSGRRVARGGGAGGRRGASRS